MFTLKIRLHDEVEVLEFKNLISAIEHAEGNASTYDDAIINEGQLNWYLRGSELFAAISGPITYTIERKG